MNETSNVLYPYGIKSLLFLVRIEEHFPQKISFNGAGWEKD
jgi:hypothetical protein